MIGYMCCVDEHTDKWIHDEHLPWVNADSSKSMWRQSLPTACLAYDPYNGLFKVWLMFKPQCLLYVPPGLTFKNSTFCPHKVCVFRGTQYSDYFPVQH